MADEPNKPYWIPDMQGFLAVGIVAICGLALLVRLFFPSNIDDKILDMMITILFSTCLVTVYNYTFGSSRGSAAKDETLSKIASAPATAAVPPAPVTVNQVNQGEKA